MSLPVVMPMPGNAATLGIVGIGIHAHWKATCQAIIPARGAGTPIPKATLERLTFSDPMNFARHSPRQGDIADPTRGGQLSWIREEALET